MRCLSQTLRGIFRRRKQHESNTGAARKPQQPNGDPAQTRQEGDRNGAVRTVASETHGWMNRDPNRRTWLYTHPSNQPPICRSVAKAQALPRKPSRSKSGFPTQTPARCRTKLVPPHSDRQGRAKGAERKGTPCWCLACMNATTRTETTEGIIVVITTELDTLLLGGCRA